MGDGWRLSRILSWQAYAAILGEGDPIAARTAAEEGRDLADAIGDRFLSRACRWWLGLAQMMQGDLAGAAAQFREWLPRPRQPTMCSGGPAAYSAWATCWPTRGTPAPPGPRPMRPIEAAAELGGFFEGFAYAALAVATLAAGDVAAAADASAAAWQRLSVQRELAVVNVNPIAQAALARGDLIAARRWADDAASATAGWHLSQALTTRARVAIALGEPAQAERDAHDALSSAADMKAYAGRSRHP